MRKLTIAIIMLMSSISLASAELGVKIGMSADLGTFSSSAKELEGGETSKKKDAESLIGFGSFFFEKDLAFLPGPFGRLSIGYSYVPHDIKSGTTDREDTDKTTTATGKLVRQKVQVDFSNFNTLYATVNITDWLYVKMGTMEIDLTTNEKLDTGSKYGNTSLDGSTYGAGVHIEKDNGLFFRFEVNEQSFDGVTLTSTTNSANKVTVTDLDGTTAKMSIGKAF